MTMNPARDALRSLLVRSVAALAAAAMLAPVGAAWAYIPPSGFLIAEVAKRHQGFKGVRIRSTVNGMKDGRLTGVQFRESTVVDFGTRTVRSKAQDMMGKDLYVVERKLDAGGEGAVPLVTRLLLEPKAEALARALKAAGIPVRLEEELQAAETEDAKRALEVTSIKRLPAPGPGPGAAPGAQPPAGASTAPIVAWVIGRASLPASPTDKTPEDPQLWLEKDGFLPLRLVSPGPEGGVMQVRFETFRFYRELPYPKVIETAQLRDEVLDVAVNPELGELKNPIPGAGFTELGSGADSAVRDLIKQYYGSVR